MRKSVKTLCVGFLLLGSMAANAGPLLWNFAYTGTGVSANGILTTDSTLIGGAYQITGLSGQRKGESILGLVPAGTIAAPGGWRFSNNLLDAIPPGLGYAGFAFSPSRG